MLCLSKIKTPLFDDSGQNPVSSKSPQKAWDTCWMCAWRVCSDLKRNLRKREITSMWFIFQDVRPSHHNGLELSQNPGIENSLCWLLQLGNTWGKFSGETERENSFSVSKNRASPWLELFSLCSQNGYSQVDHVNSTCGWLQKSTCGTPDLY